MCFISDLVRSTRCGPNPIGSKKERKGVICVTFRSPCVTFASDWVWSTGAGGPYRIRYKPRTGLGRKSVCEFTTRCRTENRNARGSWNAKGGHLAPPEWGVYPVDGAHPAHCPRDTTYYVLLPGSEVVRLPEFARMRGYLGGLAAFCSLQAGSRKIMDSAHSVYRANRAGCKCGRVLRAMWQ